MEKMTQKKEKIVHSSFVPPLIPSKPVKRKADDNKENKLITKLNKQNDSNEISTAKERKSETNRIALRQISPKKEMEEIISSAQNQMDQISAALSKIEISTRDRISKSTATFIEHLCEQYRFYGESCQAKISRLVDVTDGIISSKDKIAQVTQLFERMGNIQKNPFL